MAEIATIARPYAEALFQATPEAEQAAATGWVDELAAVAGHTELTQFAANPRVSAAQVSDVVAGLLRAPLPPAGRNLLQTVIENGRLSALPEIARQFRGLVNARAGSADAMVYSAFPIDAVALADLGQALSRRFGRPLNLTVQQDASLIGGVRVVVGDEVLDTSVRARLEQMKAVLAA